MNTTHAQCIMLTNLYLIKICCDIRVQPKYINIKQFGRTVSWINLSGEVLFRNHMLWSSCYVFCCFGNDNSKGLITTAEEMYGKEENVPKNMGKETSQEQGVQDHRLLWLFSSSTCTNVFWKNNFSRCSWEKGYYS